MNYLTINEAVKLLNNTTLINHLNLANANLNFSEKVVYHQLLTLATEVSFGESDGLKLRMTQVEIAETIGITLSNLKRKLKVFVELGLIEVTKEPEHRFDATKTYLFKKVEMEEVE